jgi:hypothetical protein
MAENNSPLSGQAKYATFNKKYLKNLSSVNASFFLQLILKPRSG